MFFSITETVTQENIELIVEEILQKLADGANFAALIIEYGATSGSDEEDGDMGWDSMSYFESAYYDVLDELNVGEATSFVGEKDAVYIVLCTDEFAPDEEGNVAFETVPTDIVDLLRDYWMYLNEDKKFFEYIDGKIDEVLVVNPMPKNLPYDVDMRLAEDIPETPPPDYSASEPDAVESALAAGLVIIDVVEGEGELAEPGSKVYVLYTGYFEDGTVFDASAFHGGEPISFVLGTKSVIAGWDAGVVGMRVGGARQLIIPASLAYGEEGRPGIPPNSTLYFDVMLVDVVG